MILEFVDSHTHLDVPDFDGDREEVIARAKAVGVTRIVTIGPSNGIESSRAAIKLANSHDGIWASVGIHPHDVAKPYEISELQKLSQEPKVVAFGEIGLDFYRNWSPFDLQEEHFRLQLELAKRIKKPLIIHSREAGLKCLEILKEYHVEDLGGVFHCYSEDAEFAKKLRDINFLISIPGSLTFKKAYKLQEAAKETPLEQLMLETDAPFLAPVPYRGKRCESSFLIETAKCLAAIKGISLKEVAETTTANAIRFFGLE